MVEESKPKTNYYNVLADGKFHLEVPEGTEGAVVREYETSDGKKGSKIEKLFQSISGKLTKVALWDGNFGQSLLLTIEDEGEAPLTISLSTSSNYGEDMLKKLPNINLDLPVKLVPYCLEDEKTKRTKKGVTVYQGVEKIQSYYTYKDPATGKISNVNGYPHVPTGKGKKAPTKDDWKVHFISARKVMLEKVIEMFNVELDF